MDFEQLFKNTLVLNTNLFFSSKILHSVRQY